jgi:hypothetical protein
LIDAAANALVTSGLGGLGPWAAEIDLDPALLCRSWPGGTGLPLATGPLPDVPVLALSGDRDMRTPTAGAIATVAQFPQGHVLVAPGVGHDVLDSSTCVDNAVRTWLDGGVPPASCPRIRPLIAPSGPIPSSVTTTAGGSRRGRTLAAVSLTLREVLPLLVELPGTTSIHGLVGGSVGWSASSLVPVLSFKHYSDIAGIEMTGAVQLEVAKLGISTPFLGTIKITGSKAAHGSVRVHGASVRFQLPRSR